MDKIIPVVMVRNESVWIERIVTPLAQVFGTVLVGDTGSNDGTAEIAEKIPGVFVTRYGELQPGKLGQIRGQMGKLALAYDARLIFQVDGDELYNVDTLTWLKDTLPDKYPIAGYTNLLSLDEAENGELWEIADAFSRLAIFPADTKWIGEYPFEYPQVFEHPELFRYFAIPPGYRYHGLHLHRCRRSAHDKDVYLRLRKQKQFSMQDRNIPRTVKFDLAAWIGEQKRAQDKEQGCQCDLEACGLVDHVESGCKCHGGK